MSSYEKRKFKSYTCVVCDNVFTSQASFGKTCSTKCRNKYLNDYNIKRRQTSVESSLCTIVAGCRSRAKRRGLECDIDFDYVKQLLVKQQGLCAMTGAVLECSNANTKRNSSPNTVSIDRIDSNKGYTKDNIRLVTYMYNSCKGRWTDFDVIQMCKGVLKFAQ